MATKTNNLVVNGLITRTMDYAGNGLEILNADLAFGLSAEDKVINQLAEKFNEKIKKTEQYCKYDALGETGTKYEIKTRRNRMRQYPDTIIPVHKTTVEGRLVFVFCYTDHLTYIIYDKEKFANYKVSNISAIRRGGIRTSIPHIHIPVEDLIVIL